MRARAYCIKALFAAVLYAGAISNASAALPGGTLDPTTITKYEMPLLVPPAMPISSKKRISLWQTADYYRIAVRQFKQQILPDDFPKTTVWGYGSVDYPGTVEEGGTFNYPSFTIEAKVNRPVQVTWENGLVADNGSYLPHLLPVDQTLHWANPAGGEMGRDREGADQTRYTGPVPMVTHVHGAHTTEDSDGYPEAWYLPAANNIPAGYATTGTFYDYFNMKYGLDWKPGSAMFTYPNDQDATTLWYHDHSLGMTRLNVYAGPAGFYLLRGGPADRVLGRLPGPAPSRNGKPGSSYYEIPIAIQDRSFNSDGSLFYPDNRAFFEGLEPWQLQIPFKPDPAVGGPSDVSPIWNPEFFGNTMVVNGRTWPYLEVEQRRYRFRLLNGCGARFLILAFSSGMPFYQIGAEGGFLPAPVTRIQLLMAPAERADVIVDFSDVPVGTKIILKNLGPDDPFGGGDAGIDYIPSDTETTGQVMQFRVVERKGYDFTTPPAKLRLPHLKKLGAEVRTRKLSLNEDMSMTVFYNTDNATNIVFDQDSTEAFGPTMARLGTLNADNSGNPQTWSDNITEQPSKGDTEIWEIFNFTEDAHPIHVHLVQFKVVNRQALDINSQNQAQFINGTVTNAFPWEEGYKDTVIAYPGQVTRIKARFDTEGFYVWHCHIIEHEDNEMMRPYHVGEIPADAPVGKPMM